MKRDPQTGTFKTFSAVDVVKRTWGGQEPNWVTRLAEECDLTSQAATARRISCSASYVSTLLNNRFKGNLNAIETAVKKAFSAETVYCHGLEEEITGSGCLNWQKKAKHLRATSPHRVRMWKSCRVGCPHSQVTVKSTAN